MVILQRSPRRPGVTAVEFAVVCLAVPVLLFTLIVGGIVLTVAVGLDRFTALRRDRS